MKKYFYLTFILLATTAIMLYSGTLNNSIAIDGKDENKLMKQPSKFKLKSRTEILAGFEELTEFIQANKLFKDNQIEKISITIQDDFEEIATIGYRLNAGTYYECDQSVTDEAYQIASITKAFSAYVALKLNQEKYFELDEPMLKYAGNGFKPDGNYANQISLKMLLEHSSGLDNDYIQGTSSANFFPGTKFSYSGKGYDFLQNCCENITHKDFSKLLETYFAHLIHKKPFIFGFSIMYRGKLHEIRSAGSSLVTTSQVVSNFFSEVARSDPHYLDSSITQKIITPSFRVNEKLEWGLGLSIYHTTKGDLIWHWGKNPEYQALALIYRNTGTGIVILTKTKLFSDSIIGELRKLAYQAIGGTEEEYTEHIPQIVSTKFSSE